MKYTKIFVNNALAASDVSKVKELSANLLSGKRLKVNLKGKLFSLQVSVFVNDELIISEKMKPEV
jgi:hypothetical protein